jgi:hypothetical protein
MANRAHPHREQGSALFITIILLALMGALGIAALDTVTTDQQVAGVQFRTRSAFYAAEAAAAAARNLVRNVGSRADTPAFPTQGAPAPLGQTASYPYGQPGYYGDPDYPNPIRWIKDGSVWGQGGNLQMKGQKFIYTLWQINVVGQTADGTSKKLEVVESKILSAGY